jgi:hypothetical protein|tara:strand:- start:12694 stop:13620 length:927 start_codon:yes stop_codon:yes gene_type:complete
MAYLTDYQYYENNGNPNAEDANWGSYQYITLNDIVNNFMLMYVGNDKLINNVERYNIIFHAKRAIQELNYDSLKEIKILELQVCDTLRYVLPQDYVNWVRISLYKNGTLMPLTENIQTNWSDAYLQDNNCRILFDHDGNILKPSTSTLDLDRISKGKKSIYLNQQSQYNGQEGYFYNGLWYFEYPVGARYGLNTETANANPTFKINKKGGVINFSSDMADELVVLEYVSDGMEGGVDSEISVNKLFEEFIYSYIKFVILQSKFGIQEYIINRARKEKSALLRNSKLRLSNIHPGRLLMNLRGQNKWIK